MILVRWPRIAQLMLLTAVVLPLAATARAQSAEAIGKVVNLMQANGYPYHATKSPSVWTIHFEGRHLKDIKVVLTLGGDTDPDLVVFVTVTEKRRMPVTTDFMRTLLEQDHKLDDVKVGFDADGDLEVRIDARLRVTDAAEFKEIVTQVESNSDYVYGLIEPQLQD
jgi:hypothetical protein